MEPQTPQPKYKIWIQDAIGILTEPILSTSEISYVPGFIRFVENEVEKIIPADTVSKIESMLSEEEKRAAEIKMWKSWDAVRRARMLAEEAEQQEAERKVNPFGWLGCLFLGHKRTKQAHHEGVYYTTSTCARCGCGLGIPQYKESAVPPPPHPRDISKGNMNDGEPITSRDKVPDPLPPIPNPPPTRIHYMGGAKPEKDESGAYPYPNYKTIR